MLSGWPDRQAEGQEHRGVLNPPPPGSNEFASAASALPRDVLDGTALGLSVLPLGLVLQPPALPDAPPKSLSSLSDV